MENDRKINKFCVKANLVPRNPTEIKATWEERQVSTNAAVLDAHPMVATYARKRSWTCALRSLYIVAQHRSGHGLYI